MTKTPPNNLPWPCPPQHPRTTVYEVSVKHSHSRCSKVGCRIYGLTAAEMRDAWGRMRVVGIVESLIGSVKGCAKDEPEARIGGSDEGCAKDESVAGTSKSEVGGKGGKKVRWGEVEVITYEVVSENDADVGEIV